MWRIFKHHHAVWHVFVLGGTVCHFFAVLLFASLIKKVTGPLAYLSGACHFFNRK